MQKCMSVFTAILLSFCIIIMPMTTAVAIEDTSQPNTGDEGSVSTGTSIEDVTVSNSTDLGDLLNNEIAEKEAEQQENMGNNIFSVTVENNVANVEFETTQDSTIVVGIYDEQGVQMITSADIAVTSEQKNISVELDSEKMPDYFYIKAFIVDSDTLRPMCTVYESPNYTQEMQEFFAMTTDDFEEEQVLNLDESKQNNFAVYKDSTIVIQKKANANIVVSADSENNVYVIQNPDDTLTGLQAGDVFAYDHSDEDIIIAKVAQTVINGDTITITGTDDFDISDVFDYIKLDQTAAENGTEDEPESNGMKTTSTSANIPDLGFDNEYKLKNVINLSIEKKFPNDENDPTATVTVKAKLSGTIEGSFKYFLHLSDQYIEFKLASSIQISGSISGKVQAKIPLQKLGVKIQKVFEVDFSPCFEVSVSGSVTLSGKVTNTAVLRIGVNGVSKQNTSKADFDFKLKVTVFIGLSFEPKIEVLQKAEAKASMKAGVEISGEIGPHLSTESGTRHSCNLCIDGDVKAVFEISLSAKFGKNSKVEYNPVKVSEKLFDFYYSIDHNQFGLGECPYKEYKCTITVKDSNGNPVSSATINDTYTTDSNGKVVVYLKPEKVTLIAKKDNSEGKYEGNITAPTSITIELSQEYIAKGDWGQCHWEIDKNGKLTIGGTIPNTNGYVPWQSRNDKIREIYIKPNTKTSSDASTLFYNLPNVREIDLSNLDTTSTQNMSNMFRNCQNLGWIQFGNNFTTKNVTDMSYMFCDCYELSSMNLNGFDTSKVQDMNAMFSGCENLSSIDVGTWDTHNVRYMYRMFNGCENLEVLYLGNFDTSNVIQMASMFSSCYKLRLLDISSFNTSNVVNMEEMFYACLNLSVLNVSNFDTSNVVYMNYMFSTCRNLATLDLSSFNTSNVRKMRSMFMDCNNLKTIIVGSGWNTGNVNDGSQMFLRCNSLVGGAGTTYSYNGLAYAHIDGGTSNPGYLTATTNIIGDISYVSAKDTKIVRTKDGQIFRWGSVEDYGRIRTPQKSNLYGFRQDQIQKFVQDSSKLYLLLNDGSFYVWGEYNYNGDIGDGTTVGNKKTPIKIMDNVRDFVGNGFNTFAITNDNVLYGWGKNDWDDQLMYGSKTNVLSPHKISDNVKNIVQSSSDGYAFIKENGDLYLAGRFTNEWESYSSGSTYLIRPPRRILQNVKYVSLTGDHGGAVTEDGSLYVWGENLYGELGIGTSGLHTGTKTPTKIMDNIKSICFENNKSAALSNDGKLYTWGKGWINSSLTPKKVMDNVVYFDANWYCLFYVKTDGKLYAYGANTMGDYADGTTNSVDYPIEIQLPKSTTSTAARMKTTSTAANVVTTAQLTENYTDLEPNETYNFYVMKEVDTEKTLNSDNLYYITQAQADENGELAITYAPTEDYETAYRFVVAYHRKNVAYAQVTATDLTYTSEEQYIKPTVILDDVELVEGVDYELTGSYSATDAGEYTVTINGIGNYTGTLDYIYNVTELVNTSSLDVTALIIGDTVTIQPSATGGVGEYTYTYYFRKSDTPEWTELTFADENLTFTPETTGKYYIRIDVTDENEVTTKKAILLKVNPETLVNTSSISSEEITTNDILVLKASALCGTEPYQYAYYYKDILTDIWEILSDYSDNVQYQFQIPKAGSYDVCIKVMDADGTVAKKYFAVDVSEFDFSQIPDISEKIEAVAVTCTTDGNIEYYILDGRYYKPQNDTFIEITLAETIVPKTGHNYVYNENSTSTSEGHTMVCTHCGDTLICEHDYENDICTVCGYEKENLDLIDWNNAEVVFTDDRNGLYAYTKRIIAPEFTIIYDGRELEEYADYDFTDDSETESKGAGKHTITVFDKNDENNTFSFDYYIYNLGITATETANSDSKIKFTATRNADKVNVTKFGMVFDRKGTFKESLSLENRTNISTTTTKSTSKYNVNVADSGKGVYARPYMQVTLNGENYIAYGEVQFFTRYTPEQIAVPTVQDIEPQLVNGKVSVKVQKPVYDTEVYTCKEMGVIFSKNGTITSLENAQTSNILIYENVGNGNVSKGYVNGAKISEQSLDNYSSYSANIGFVNGNPVYTRAYVIFTNKNTNEDMVVYGNYFVNNQ